MAVEMLTIHQPVAASNIKVFDLPPGVADAAEVPAVLAASVIVVRPPFDILMIRRPGRSSFVPNAWVFPGGAADQVDYQVAREQELEGLVDAMRVTAARELFEEAGLWLGGPLEDAEQRRRQLLEETGSLRELLQSAPVAFSTLRWISHWITPVGFPKRFDTYFFVVRAPEGAVATAANSEAVEVTWISPASALERYQAGEFHMVFPTIKNLEAMAAFDSLEQLLASHRESEIPVIQPVIVTDGGRKKIVLS